MRVRSSNVIAFVSTAATLLLAGCATTESPKAATAAVPMKVAVAVKMRAASEIQMTEILDDPKKMAVLEKHAPSLAGNPQLSMARGMTLAQVAGYTEAGLSEPMVKSICEDISKL